MRCAESKQQMNVVGNFADCLGNNFQSFCNTTKKGMKTRPPFGRNERTLMFGAENDVNVQAEMG